MSKALAGLTAILGVVIMIIGLSGVAPIGPTSSPAISNPAFPFATAFWVLGIMVVLLTPIAYVLGKD